jgi:hypothetical protein
MRPDLNAGPIRLRAFLRHRAEIRVHLHQVVLEEVLQLPLGGRVREVSNVESPALSGARTHGLIVGGRGLLSTGILRVGRSVVVGEGGGGHLGGDTVDRCGHF